MLELAKPSQPFTVSGLQLFANFASIFTLKSEVLRIDNSGWSVNCTAPINEVWTGCSQRVYYILHIFR